MTTQTPTCPTCHADPLFCACPDPAEPSVYQDGDRILAVEPEPDHETDECVYCGATVIALDVVPGVGDDAAWLALGLKHHPACEWIATRAHRLDPPLADAIVLGSGDQLMQTTRIEADGKATITSERIIRAGEREPMLEDYLAPTGEPWPVKLLPDDIAAIVDQLAARLAGQAVPLQAISDDATRPLTASLHVARKVSDNNYGSVEASVYLSGVTADATEADIDALLEGPAGIGWKKIVTKLNERMQDQELHDAGTRADPRSSVR